MRAEKRDVPQPPEFCTSSDCMPNPKKAFLRIVEIEDEHYQRAIGVASSFKIGGQWKFGIEVKGWHTRCPDCFYSDPINITEGLE